MKPFSPSWKASASPRKQRKYRARLPLHLRRKLMHAVLSKELRKKYRRRSFTVRRGDKVRVMRGRSRSREAKVERVDYRNERLELTGIERTKKDGAKLLAPVHPSNVMIIELDVSDKLRKQKLGANLEAEMREAAP